ncbi:5,10-methylenetetrahydrofolate reductase [compost metagenome]
MHEDVETFKSDFCIGVAGYPEKHFEAPNLNTDFKYLKQKVDMGAGFIVTQMFFDNQKYFDFVNKCRENGINVPIIPGLKPISTLSQLNVLPKIFHIDLPDELTDALSHAKNNAEAKEIGTQAMIKQCKELIEFGAPVLHFYTMGKPDQTKEIAKAVF